MDIDDFAKTERQRIRAMESGDALKYAVLCEKLGMPPERQDLYEQGLAEILMNEASVIRIEEEQKRRVYIDFVKRAEKLNYKDIFKDTNRKRELLGILGYTHLTGPSKQRIPLGECSDARIGKAFLNCYKSAREYIQKHGAEEYGNR